MRTIYNKEFHDHKHSARRRGVQFSLSFQEWIDIWKASGQINNRGRRAGDYCMARFGDCGAYEIGNVKIVTNRENRKEQQVTDLTRDRMRSAKLGRVLSADHKAKIGLKSKGRRHTVASKLKISIGRLGSRNPAAKLSEQDVIYIRRSKELHKDIADKFGISRSLIGLIKNWQRWAHVR